MSHPGAWERSIPACAGEPTCKIFIAPPHKVYPRVCGGTPPRPGIDLCAKGLSPRVRGNQAEDHPYANRLGSIPACAGEPIPAPPLMAGRRVYPRVCGGTMRRNCWRWPVRGLSPRVRGNRAGRRIPAGRSGSIPACAGEPRCRRHSPRDCQVYPRVCGGTRSEHGVVNPNQGLSPRVRGNPGLYLRSCRLTRSIPACAGEPGA